MKEAQGKSNPASVALSRSWPAPAPPRAPKIRWDIKGKTRRKRKGKLGVRKREKRRLLEGEKRRL